MGEASRVEASHEEWPSLAFFYAGIVSLIGWNGLLTASGYLDRVIFAGRDWAFVSSILFAAGSTAGQALVIAGPLPKLPFFLRWTVSVTVLALAPLGILLIVELPGDDVDRGCLFKLALACVTLLALGASMFQGTVFGLAGAADPMLCGRIMTGQGIAGIITGIAGFFHPGTTNFVVLITSAALITTLAMLVFFGMMRENESLKRFLDPRQQVVDSQRLVQPARRGTAAIMRDVAPQAFGVFFVFVVTFTVFPGVVVRWSGSLGFDDTSFVTLVVGVFQIMDVLGRILAGCVMNPDPKTALGASVSRVVFIPLFIAAQRATDSFWSNGVWKLLLMAWFSFSNGLVATLTMMLGPQQVRADEEKDTAGKLMSFSLVSGIFAGSLLGLLTQL